MNDYRCTRNSVYPPTSPGHTDLTAREGYYVRAATRDEALRAMRRRFPDDLEGFTAEK